MRTLENTPLTLRQQKILEVVNDFKFWRPPSIKIIKTEVGIKHNKTVIENIKSLQKRGLIKPNPFLTYIKP